MEINSKKYLIVFILLLLQKDTCLLKSTDMISIFLSQMNQLLNNLNQNGVRKDMVSKIRGSSTLFLQWGFGQIVGHMSG
jgi:hypothetical protein